MRIYFRWFANKTEKVSYLNLDEQRCVRKFQIWEPNSKSLRTCEKNYLQAQKRKLKGESKVRMQVIGNTSDHMRSITTDRSIINYEQGEICKRGQEKS